MGTPTTMKTRDVLVAAAVFSALEAVALNAFAPHLRPAGGVGRLLGRLFVISLGPREEVSSSAMLSMHAAANRPATSSDDGWRRFQTTASSASATVSAMIASCPLLTPHSRP